MSAGQLLFIVGGLLVVGGLALVLLAVFSPPPAPETAAAPTQERSALITPLRLVGVGFGVLVLLFTGWPVAGIAAAAAVMFVPSLLGGGTAAKREILKAEALSDWTRRLSDLIASGAASSTVEAIRRTLSSVPDIIAAEVANLVARMRPQGTEAALRLFAREVDHSAADKIAMVLILRERNGGPGLAEVLTGLADDLDERARMIREVESERAKPRGNMRTIVAVIFGLVALLVIFGQTFLKPYSSLFGQFALLVVVAIFAVALRWMHRLSATEPSFRVLVDPPGTGGPR